MPAFCYLQRSEWSLKKRITVLRGDRGRIVRDAAECGPEIFGRGQRSLWTKNVYIYAWKNTVPTENLRGIDGLLRKIIVLPQVLLTRETCGCGKKIYREFPL